MTNAKWTSGPWRLETESRSADGSDLIVTDREGGYTVASCRVGSTGVQDATEAECNARLIAEAPAMAEVLREWADAPMACVVRRGEAAPVRDCDCWACGRTNRARAILSRIDGE